MKPPAVIFSSSQSELHIKLRLEVQKEDIVCEKEPLLSPLWVKFTAVGRPLVPAATADQTPSRCLVFSFKVYFSEEGLEGGFLRRFM